MTSCTIGVTAAVIGLTVVKGFQVKIFDELYHLTGDDGDILFVVKGFQVKIFDELYHPRRCAVSWACRCERLSGQDL